MKKYQKYAKARGRKSTSEAQHNERQFQSPIVNHINNKLVTKNSLNDQNGYKITKKYKKRASYKKTKIFKDLANHRKIKIVKNCKKYIIKSTKQKINRISQAITIVNSIIPKIKKIHKKVKMIKGLQTNGIDQHKKRIFEQNSANGVRLFSSTKQKVSDKKSVSKTLKKAQISKSIRINKISLQRPIQTSKSVYKLGKSKGKKMSQSQQNKPSNEYIGILEPLSAPKKKGRPKGPQQGSSVTQERSLVEQKQLGDFIEHAINLRKLKNQKQFYECFSRITQFVKQSWQYGDLAKKIRSKPRNQELLRIGIQIVRGIRKKIQQQASTQIVV